MVEEEEGSVATSCTLERLVASVTDDEAVSSPLFQRKAPPHAVGSPAGLRTVDSATLLDRALEEEEDKPARGQAEASAEGELLTSVGDDDELPAPVAEAAAKEDEAAVEEVEEVEELEEVEEVEEGTAAEAAEEPEVVAADLPPLREASAEELEPLLGPVTAGELFRAAESCETVTVRRLIAAGASVNAPLWRAGGDGDGDVFVTLLHVLCSRPELPRSVEVIAEIARGKANLNARSSLGRTPLARACLHKHISAAGLLLELGADPNPLDDAGRSALHCAVLLDVEAPPALGDVRELSARLVTMLADRTAEMDCGGEAPPLLSAVNALNGPAVAALLKHGAAPRFLHVAASKAPLEIVEGLLAAEANPLEEDQDGNTVLDIAFARGDEEITTMLRDGIGDYQRKYPHKSRTKHKQVKMKNAGSTGKGEEDEEEDAEDTLGLSSQQLKGDRSKRNKRQSLTTRASHIVGRKRNSSLTSGQGPVVVKAKHGWHHRALRQAKERWVRVQVVCRRVNKNRNFQLLMLWVLIAALFMPDIWVLFDAESNDGLDGLLVAVLVLFIIEMTVQIIGTPRTYIGSFFFWTDVVGVLSVPLDHSLVSERLPQSLDNAALMRAARTARLAARAGRFTKLVKLLRFLPGQTDAGPAQGTAKRMSSTLLNSVSMRVSCLIIVMVMVLPLFDMTTYPENDYSMKAWLNSLAMTLDTAGISTFDGRLTQFESFYNEKGYFPIEVTWAANGTSETRRLQGARPRRAANQLVIKADLGAVEAVFNFGTNRRTDAICNVFLILLIIIMMMGFSLLLSSSVSAIVFRPLEELLASVRGMASKIFTSVAGLAASAEGEEDRGKGTSDELDEGEDRDETEMLGKVIEKLATIGTLTLKASALDAEALEQMGESDRAVLQGFTLASHSSTANADRSQAQGERSSGRASTSSLLGRVNTEDEVQADELASTLECHLEEAGLAWGVVDSWDFDVLEMEEHQRCLSCLCFVVFHLGLGYTQDQQEPLINFIQGASTGYTPPAKAPYHNWFHAVDVTHCVFRMLNMCAAERYLSNTDRFALVVSAVCHDMGHPGFNNPFLVETGSEIAIRYNDRSPLENMHCAKLFELAGKPRSAIFGFLDRPRYKEVRQVCVEAILHTDNVQHFPMIKELQVLYEMNCEVFDLSLQLSVRDELEFPPREIIDIFVEPDKKTTLRNLFLHFSDISNPMKPWGICHRWAWNIVDEFFLQGDKEKELGITVQPLNDRDKVNRPYSQIGFIEFFIAPLATVTVRLLPPLADTTEQMVQNLNAWCEEWVSTTTPAPDAEEKKKVQDRISKVEGKLDFVRQRTVNPRHTGTGP